jgi:hypothetical protein
MVSKIKPDARAEYEAFQKDITAAYKKAGVPYRAVLQTVFGDLTEYISVSPLKKFADLDDTWPLDRAVGAEGAAKLRKRGAALITSQHRYASRSVPGLRIQTRSEKPSPYAMVTYYRLVPEKAEVWTNFMKNDYMPVLQKGAVKNWWVNQTLFGGHPNERVVVRLMDKLGEFDDGPLTTKILGPEGAQKLQAKAAGTSESVRFTVIRYLPDLSYENTPDPKTAANPR